MNLASKLVLDKVFWMVNTDYVMKKLAQGFTLIELLIVIAVLGILAVAVLSAINPIEQINRSKDTGSRSDAEQLLGAIDRFYATAGYYPWRTSPLLGTDATAWSKVDATWLDNLSAKVLDKLSTAGTGELKTSFTTRITTSGYNTLWKYNGGAAGNSTYVCFKPASSSFETEATNRCGATVPADFPAKACSNTTDCGTVGNCSCLP